MTTIQVLLFKSTSFVSKVIRFVTRSEYSHVGIAIDNNYYEAKPGYGVRHIVNWQEKFKKEEYDIYTYTLPEHRARMMEYFLIEQVGKHYDWLGLVGFVFGLAHQPGESRQRWFCSELAAVSFLKVDVQILRADPWVLSPSHIAMSPVLKK